MKFAAIVLAATVATTTSQPKPVPYLESIEVAVNNVDVIVTDHAGNRVRGLQRSDFELLENNAPQAISNFYEVRGAGRAPAAAPESVAADVRAAEPRKLVMLFDELSLHPSVAGDLERRAGELVDAALQPGDQLMVLTPTAKTKIALPFTSDKQAIHKAIAGVMRDSAFHANTALTREMMLFEREVVNAGRGQLVSAAQMYEMVATRRVRQTLGYLQAVVSALAEVPGKKSVIFVTLSAPAEPGRDAYGFRSGDAAGRPVTDLDTPGRTLTNGWRTLQPYIDDIARTASTNGVTIYCLQPDVALGPTVPDVVAGGRPGRGSIRVSSGSAGPSGVAFTATWQGTQRTFETLAGTTGGMWWRGGSGVKPLFRQVAEDGSDYYSLGYHASSEERDKTRAIVVRVRNHPEYDVRSRHAVVRKSAPNEMRDLVIARLLDDRPIDELNVRVSAGKASREALGSLLLPVDIKVPLSKLTFLRDGDVYRASFRVHYAAASSRLDFAPGEGREQVVEVPTVEMPNIGGKYFTYTTSLRVMPGEVTVSVGVLDPLSHLATIKTMRVDAR